MSNEIPYLGSKISLISKAEIRYEGILYSIDANESTVALAKVRSFGTEDRQTDHPVQPRDEVFEYIIFRGTDIKDLHVCDTNKVPINQTPHDPAIVQSSMSSNNVNSIGSSNMYPFGGQAVGSYPPQQMQGPYPSYNAFGHQNFQTHSNYQGSQSQFSGAPSTHSDSHGTTPPLSMNAYRPRRASDSRSPSPPPQQLPSSLTNSNVASMSMGGPNDYSSALLDDRSRMGGNRGASHSRGRYSQVTALQQHQQQQQQLTPPHHQQQQQQNYINREYVRSDYQQQRQQQQQQQHGYLNRENGPFNNSRYNKENYPSSSSSSQQQQQHQHHYQDSPQQQQQQQQQRVYPSNNNVNFVKGSIGNLGGGGGGGQQYDFRFQRGRGLTRGYFNNASNLRVNRGSGHMIRGGSRGYAGRTGFVRFGRPGVLKFDSEFDFESSNAQFDKCQIEKELKEKLKIASKDQTPGDETAVDGAGDDVNGETTQTGHSAFYDKNKSFFDSISCEALDKNGSAARTNWREERKLNFETFGLRSSNGFRGRYRGRGGGSYGRGYSSGMDNGYHSGRGYGGFRGGDRSWPNQYRGGGIGGRGYRSWNKHLQSANSTAAATTTTTATSAVTAAAAAAADNK